jgi:sortase (surface protein transpeptidase)
MKLRAFRRTTIALLIAAALSVAGTSGIAASDFDTLHVEDHGRVATPPSFENGLPSSFHDTYSLTYEAPRRQTTRSREDCPTVFSRFCDLLSGADPEQRQDGQDDEVAEQPQIQSPTNQVSWKSASISNLSAEPRVEPTGLEVPSLAIKAAVSGVGVDAARKMEVPDNFNTVGWYRYGPTPGNTGNTVIAGHLDDHQGRSVFFDLQYVEIGAEVVVRLENGESARFRVREKVSYDAGKLPSQEIFRRDGDPTLALITCGGVWDSNNGRYSETMVVYAVPVS